MGAEADRREMAERWAKHLGGDANGDELHEMAWAIVANLGGKHNVSYEAAVSAAGACVLKQRAVRARLGFRAGDHVSWVNDDGETVTGTITGWTPLIGQAFVDIGDEPGGIIHVEEMMRA
jgi:hypothetical protein